MGHTFVRFAKVRVKKIMLVIGLTGNIASGKTTVAKMFEANGQLVICSDEVVRRLQKPKSPALAKIAHVFGGYAINEDGSLNRKWLADMVFKDITARKKLNDIMHPLVVDELKKATLAAKRLAKKHLVLDIPLLYEANLEHLVDVVVVVYTSKDVQLERLMKRDGISEQTALEKISSQMDSAKKASRADFIIENNGTIEELEKNFESIFTLATAHLS